ncbi:MAG: tol-pal system protein YbgF [Thermodesulfobacteriota bacterium]
MTGNILNLGNLSIALLLIPLLYGCGPGFPIMTAAQEEMVLDVAHLKKESARHKKQLARLEKELSGGGDGGLEALGFEIKTTRAELDADMNGIREDMASLRGEIEEAKHASDLLRESIGDIEIRMEERGASRDTTAAQKQILTGLGSQLSSLGSRLDNLEKRIALLEKGAHVTKGTTPPQKKPESLYNRSLLLLKDKKYEKSLASFTRFIELFPNHGLTDNAQYWIGEIFYARGDWERAVLEFDAVIKKYPEGDKVAAALLKEGLSFHRLGADKEARLLLERVIESHPKSSEATIARAKLKKMEKGLKGKQ